MKKNQSVAVSVIIVVVLIIALWFFVFSKNAKNPEIPATVSTQSITDVSSPSAAVLAGAKTINWKTSNYPANVGVNINLIRKVSDSPREFTLIRTLASDIKNDGNETWIPLSGEIADDTYIEVTCSTAYQFAVGCSLSAEPIKVK